MAPPTKEERLQAVHAEALKNFDAIQAALKDERQQCLNDRRFYSIAGAQWEGNLGKQFEKRPKLEVNKVHLSVMRIISEYRNNRITVKFTPKDGVEDVKLSETCAGLFRADEQDSVAEEAYDNAFEEAVGGGFGALRLRAVYEDEEDPDNDHQRIRLEPIYDADASVFFDLDAKRQDKSDARYCFIIASMTRDRYIEAYDDDPVNWDRTVSASQFDWAPPDLVFVAEYYLIEDHGDKYITYRGTAGDEVKFKASELKDDPEKEAELATTGYIKVTERSVKIKKVHKYVLSGGSVLEDVGYVAGKHIPIAPSYGKRWFVDNVERCMGHVRLAKDAQQLKNMQLSKLAEIASLSSVEKPILLPEQIAGYEKFWAEDNITNYPYMLINPVMGKDGDVAMAAPMAYTKAPVVPQPLAALLSLTDQDIKDLLGNQPDSEKVVSNIAEATLLDMHARLDMQTYIYISNFAKTIKRVGEIWLSMAQELYVEDGRRMKSIDESDKPRMIKLNVPAKAAETDGLTSDNDLSKANLDVAVDVGPSSASRREATVKALTGMLGATQGTQDPMTAQVLMSMAIMNMEGEGIGDVREFFRKKLVDMGALKPSPEDEERLKTASKPNAQEQALKAMAEEAQAKALKAKAETLATMADVEKIHAQTIEILANVDMTTTEKAAAIMAQFNQPTQLETAALTLPGQDQGAIPPGSQQIGGEGSTA